VAVVLVSCNTGTKSLQDLQIGFIYFSGLVFFLMTEFIIYFIQFIIYLFYKFISLLSI